MTEAEQQLTAAGINQALICGELYVDHPDKKRERVHDVIAFGAFAAIAGRPESLALSHLRLVGNRRPVTSQFQRSLGTPGKDLWQRQMLSPCRYADGQELRRHRKDVRQYCGDRWCGRLGVAQ